MASTDFIWWSMYPPTQTNEDISRMRAAYDRRRRARSRRRTR